MLGLGAVDLQHCPCRPSARPLRRRSMTGPLRRPRPMTGPLRRPRPMTGPIRRPSPMTGPIRRPRPMGGGAACPRWRRHGSPSSSHRSPSRPRPKTPPNPHRRRLSWLYIGSRSASPTACRLRAVPAQRTCRRRCRDEADIEPLVVASFEEMSTPL